VELIKLKKYVYDRLKALTSITVYDGKIPQNADDIVFPYLVYKIPSGTPDENKILYICEIDYWNNTNDDSGILNAGNSVKAGFDNYWENQTDGFYTSNLDFEGEIEDTNNNISRFNQRYILKVR
jgi:hypothetical protein